MLTAPQESYIQRSWENLAEKLDDEILDNLYFRMDDFLQYGSTLQTSWIAHTALLKEKDKRRKEGK